MLFKQLVYGAGFNDADYPVSPRAAGGRNTCPYYATWKAMLKRCYCPHYQNARPSYKGCYVTAEWLKFTNFKQWMERQDWCGKCLDKDVLVKGNKVYSPETCAFVDNRVNGFLCDSLASRGSQPLGVCYYPERRKYTARCNNPFTGKRESLGCYDNASAAHRAWKRKKCEHAKRLADLQADPRVADALRKRYL